MRSKLINTLFFIVISIVLLIITIIAAGYYFDKKLSGYLISQINKQLNVKVTVEKVEFSFLDKFPNATLKFSNIYIKNPILSSQKKQINTDTLLFAKKLLLQFNLLKMIKDEYIINQIFIENAIFNFIVDEFGKNNMRIIKENDNDKDSEFRIQLKYIDFKSIKFSYYQQNKNLAIVFIHHYKLKGDFTGNNFNISGRCYLTPLFAVINENGFRFLPDDLSLNINHEINQNMIKIKQATIKFRKDKIHVAGYFKPGKPEEIEFKIYSNNINIENYLPFLYSGKKLPVITGNMAFNANLKGNTNCMVLNSIFRSDNTNLNVNNKENLIFKNAFTARLTYQTGENQKLSLSVDNFKTSNKHQVITGKIFLTGIKKLYIRGNANFEIDLSCLKQFSDEVISSEGNLNGKIEFSFINNIDSFNILSVLNDSIYLNGSSDLIQIKTKSFPEIVIKKLSLSLNKEHIFGNGFIKIDQHNAEVKKFDILFKNLLDKKPELNINLKLNTDKFDLDNFINSIPESDESSNISFNYKGIIDFQASTFKYDKLTASECTGILQFNPDEYIVDRFLAKFCSGHATGNVSFTYHADSKSELKVKTEFTKVDLKEIFKDFNNFDQSVLKANNLEGKFSGNFNFRCCFDKDYNLIDSTITSKLQYNLINGALIDFEPLYRLSKFVDIDEVKNIRFAEINNQIIVENEKIIIPETEIKSSLTKIKIFGIHQFNNQFDYRLSLQVSDLLWKKSKHSRKKNDEFGIVEDDSLRNVSVFLKIAGNDDKYDILFDKGQFKSNIKAKAKQESKLIKQMIREEIRKTPEDTVKKQAKPKSRFQIQWDELDDTVK